MTKVYGTHIKEVIYDLSVYTKNGRGRFVMPEGQDRGKTWPIIYLPTTTKFYLYPAIRALGHILVIFHSPPELKNYSSQNEMMVF